MKLARALAIPLAPTLAWVLLQTASTTPTAVPRPHEGGSTDSAVQSMKYYGLAIQVDSTRDAVSRYGAMLEEIAALGANTVLFSVNGYQRDAGSARIYVDADRTPDDGQWRALFSQAHHERLKIILMPKILLAEPRGNEWRGVIDPGQRWDEWFGDYRRFVLHYARLAAACDIEVFVVGSELVSAERHTERWKELIGEIRGVYPHGCLTYSANWDHYRSIRFWEDLDMIAMTSYYQTSREPAPDVVDLEASWRGHQSQILEWRERIGKPLLFTEVGWCSQEGCSIEPWNYFRHSRATVLGLEEQRRNYQAFIRTWQGCPEVAGVVWWEWGPGEGGPQDHGYTPRNKPAERVVGQWFQRLRDHESSSGQLPARRRNAFSRRPAVAAP